MDNLPAGIDWYVHDQSSGVWAQGESGDMQLNWGTACVLRRGVGAQFETGVCYRTGIRKASVLPDPVFAAPSASLPHSVCGRDAR
jgi:hypothetical protein